MVGRSWTRHWPLLLIVVACATAPSGPAPSSSADAKKATPATPPTDSDAPVLLLEDSGYYSYDKQARLARVVVSKFRILRKEALESEWAVASTDWYPWHEERPKLEATVKVAGQTYRLDPSTIEESRGTKRDATMFSDRRVLRAPLPNLAVGAEVEIRTEVKESKPFFVGGRTGQFYFGLQLPVQHQVLEISAPKSLPLKYVAMGANFVPKEASTSGRRKLTFVRSSTRAIPKAELNRDPAAHHYPSVAFSVAGSWQPIAEAYAEVVDKRVEAARTIAFGADVPKTGDRTAIIDKALRALHKKVRYTGLEFGQAAIIPAPPATVLERGYGDCKDKATLLVSMLRARGIDADVALVRAGYEIETVEQIPGLNHFNHAVVYVPGAEPMWIDATVEHLVVGDVPQAIQGRMALVANTKTDGLLRIPEIPSAQNKYVERRVIKMAPYGGASVSETTYGVGNMDNRLRLRYGSVTQKNLEESLKNYARDTYGSATLSTKRTDPNDVSKPYRLTISFPKAEQVVTADDDAAVPISVGAMFEWLPSLLRTTKPPEKAREGVFYLYEPYSAEITYEVDLPFGFDVRKPLKNREFVLGPAKFLIDYKQEDRKVTMVFRFDTGKRRWSPEELEAYRVGLGQLEVPRYLELDHRGALLSSRGKMKEALKLFRQAVERAPKSAEEHARLARALLQAGFGKSAEKVARKAFDLDNDSYIAAFVLGMTLSADGFGRGHSPGMDRDGAVRAYGIAKRLAPTSLNPRRNLAVTLEHNKAGVRYGPGARLDEAIDEYKAIENELKNTTLENNLRVALLRAGRLKELKERAEKAEPGAFRNAQLVAATAVIDGVDEARKTLAALGAAAEPQKVLNDAIQSLLQIRQYTPAAELASVPDANAGLRARSQAETLAKIRKWEDLLAEAKGPWRACVEFLSLTLRDDPKGYDHLLSAKTKREEKKRLSDPDADSIAKRIRAQHRVPVGYGEFGVDFYVDASLSVAEHKVEGNDQTGYRVRIRAPIPGSKSTALFWVKEGRGYKLRGFNSSLGVLGLEALSRLRKKDLKSARQWLDWAYDEIPSGASEDPLGGSLFRKVWSRDGKRDAATARVAAGILALRELGDPTVALPIVRAWRRRAPADLRARADMYIANGYLALDKHKSCGTHANKARKAAPKSKAALTLWAGCAARSGQSRAAIRTVKAFFDKNTEDVQVGRLLAALMADFGRDAKGALRVLDELIQDGAATSGTYNAYSWTGFFVDPAPEDLVSRAEKAAQATEYNDAAILHTLGTAYAYFGQPAKGMEALKVLLDRRSGSPESVDWLIVGRVAEEYEMWKEARSAYRRVVAPSATEGARTSWRLARQRLKKIARR